MQRRGRARSVERTPQRLPINCDNSLAALGKALHKANEPGMEPLGIEQPEYPAEGVMAWNAVFQHQKLLQKRPLRPAKQRHVRAGLPATQDRAQRDHHDLVQ